MAHGTNRYHITSYSIRLSQPSRQTWTGAFTLAREAYQFPLASVLHIPALDQFDDWEDFLALGNDGRTADSDEDLSRVDGVVGGDSMQALEKVVRRRVLARADTSMAAKETFLEAVMKGENDDEKDEEEERRDSGYFSLVRRNGASGWGR